MKYSLNWKQPGSQLKKSILGWPVGLLVGACILFIVFVVLIMILVFGRFRSAHFFSDQQNECLAAAAYDKTLPISNLDPILRENTHEPVWKREAFDGLNCTHIFQAHGLDTNPACDPREDGLCKPYSVVFGRAKPNIETKIGFKLRVEYPGSEFEVDFAPSKNGWREVQSRNIWVS